jgi:hypothetical protein
LSDTSHPSRLNGSALQDALHINESGSIAIGMVLLSQPMSCRAVQEIEMHRTLLALSAAAVASFPVASAQADVVYSGTVNIPVATTFNGTWLNLVDGTVAQDVGSGPAGWDVNVWVTGGTSWRLFANANGTSADGGTAVTTSGGTTASIFTSGQLIDSSAFYSTSAGVVPALGTNVYGLRLFNEGSSSIHYGWIRLDLAAGPLSGSIVDYGFESSPDVGIPALAGVPEPTTLTAVAALGTLVARRRRA